MKTCERLLSSVGMILAAFFALCVNGYSEEIKQLSLPSIPDLTRTDIYYIQPDYVPVACLVMCPGINGNGRGYLTQPELQAFARHYKVALVGLSFASDEDLLGDNKGYYTASLGAGPLLLRAIDEHISPGIPVLLYGFSGGAHFVSSFEEAYPERVMAWCAYTAAWWEDPKDKESKPPGIVACGKLDDQRFQPSFEYFQNGRKLGKPWSWIALDGTSHAETDALNQFVRAYFGGILNKVSDTGGWYDLTTKQKLSGDDLKQPNNAVWLPDNKVGELWSNLHKP